MKPQEIRVWTPVRLAGSSAAALAAILRAAVLAPVKRTGRA
jgi:hypothetical protein